MIRRTLPLALLLSAALGAQDAPLRCAAAELASHPLAFDGLQVSILKLRGDASLGRREVVLSVRNPTQGMLPFAGEDLAIVGAGGAQSALCGWSESYPAFSVRHTGPADRLRIAPGAATELTFYLERAVKLPAKLYLGGRLVAEISG
ncbi:MAG TPA: hypothetical protein VJ600_03140 [Holophagaceae bacterium]|nr:hypothetical protein [Holophagaceae bacterium]